MDSIKAYVPKLRHEAIAILVAILTIIAFNSCADVAFSHGDRFAIALMLTIFGMVMLELIAIQYIFRRVAYCKYITIEDNKIYVNYDTKSETVLSVEKFELSELTQFIYNHTGRNMVKVVFTSGKIAIIDDCDSLLYSQLCMCIE